MTLPEIIDRIKYRWNRSKPYLALAGHYIYLKAHQQKFLQGLVAGLILGYLL